MDDVLGDEISEVQVGRDSQGQDRRGVNKDFVIIDVGLKSEGQIPKIEFEETATDLTVGDEIEVLLESLEGRDGSVTLSKRKADRIRGWEKILETRNEGDVIDGRVMRKIKGGLLVDIGVPVFLPASAGGHQTSQWTSVNSSARRFVPWFSRSTRSGATSSSPDVD